MDVTLKKLDMRGRSQREVASGLPRPEPARSFPSEAVKAILEEVRIGGDDAVRRLTEKFDRVSLDSLRVPPAYVSAALGRVSSELREALELAYGRIMSYHAHEQPPLDDFVDGWLRVRHLVRSVPRAGLYAPGGRARYPSTVLMCAAPARVAGVKELALCVPPGPGGEVADETLAAAAVAGIDEVYRIGGAQAVGAMAFGTESVRPVEVIAGPGNSYVAEAKRQVSGLVGIPSAFAGPSEVVVIADASVDPRWVAVDLVVQAEHGPDGMAWLVTWSADVADAVASEVARLVEASPRREDLRSTFATGGVSVLVDGPEAAVAVANEVAPEHLELMVDDAVALLPLVSAAGAVFLGPWAPASVGDYVAGPNHVLPTARTARFASALRVDDFQVHIHAVELDYDGLAAIGPAAALIADAEGLGAHGQSIRLRLERGVEP
ncbi:MAG: histidinol dehydrogenase [Acidimicrobiales bacterium]